MKNNNKIFLAVIGVATLIIAAIGATYAYFAVAATPNTNTIKGNSNDALTSALSLTVSQVNLGGTANNTSLVPADFGVTAANMTVTQVQNALTAKCVKNGYTGCHVWKITASTSQAVSSANLKLSLTATKASGNSSGTLTPWSYVVYTGTNDTTASALATVPTGTSAAGSFGAGLSNLDIHNGAALSTSGKVYYVMIYIKNEDSNQNSGSTDARGSYSGTVTLTAMGGEVKTTFQ